VSGAYLIPAIGEKIILESDEEAKMPVDLKKNLGTSVF